MEASRENEDRGLCHGDYSAQQVPGQVILRAKGEHEKAGYEVWLEKSAITVSPPEFSLFHIAPTEPSATVITEFEVFTEFKAEEPLGTVIVHDDKGAHEVPVEQTPDAKAPS